MKTLRLSLPRGVWPLIIMSWIFSGLPGPAAETLYGWGESFNGQPIFPPGLTNIIAIAAGGDNNDLAIRSDGSLVAWTPYGLADVPPDLTNAVAVSAGDHHYLALRDDGTVVAWGANYYGATNVPRNLTNITAIAAGSDHNLALRNDGTVVAWGAEYGTPLLDSPTNIPANLPMIVSVAAGDDYSLALANNGTVFAWGFNYYGQTNVPAGLSNVVAIAAGSAVSLALRSDGTVVAWGFDFHGATEVPVHLTNVVAIATGGLHSLALKADGTVVAWGDDTYSQNQVPAGLTNVTAIAAGDNHSFALGERFPILLIQPASQQIYSGLACTLRAAAIGSDPLSYQWRLNGTDLASATGPELTIPSVQLSDAGEYTVLVSNSVASSISDPANLTVLQSPPWISRISGEPSSQQFRTGASAIFQVTATGSAPFQYQWRFNGADLPGATNSSFVISNPTLQDLGVYAVVITNWFGSITSTPAWLYQSVEYQFHAPDGPLVWFPTTLEPTVTSDQHFVWISHPDHYQVVGWSCETTWTLNTSTRTYDGYETCLTGSEDFYLFLFGYVSGGFDGTSSSGYGGSQPAPDWLDGHWKLNLRIVPHGDQLSGQALVTLDNDDVIQLQLTGTSFPTIHKSLLVLHGATGFNDLTVWLSDSDMALDSVHGTVTGQRIDFTAPRSPIPLPAKGTYNGLFFEPDDAQQASSGFFTLTLTASGSFSGKMLLDGGAYSFRGRFDTNGAAQLEVPRKHKSDLTLWMQTEPATPAIYGTVSDGAWVAELSAQRAFSNSGNPATNYLGAYTLAVPGGNDPGGSFIGDGFMTFWIEFSGAIHMTGELADGTRFSQGSRISQNGQWPLYIPLYGGKGSIMSWITFSNFPATTLGGELVWFKHALPASKFFPAGLTNQAVAMGSSFFGPIPAHGHQQLNFTNAVAILEGGNLPVALTNVVGSTNLVLNANRLTLKWDSISGLVRGSFMHPVTGKSTPIHGVRLQSQDAALGYFPGTNQSGSFRLQQQRGL